MNFPLQSTIPTVLALSDFFIKNFPNLSWYQYWYLGNPFHYLIGPVVPVSLFIFSKFGIGTETGYLLLIFLSTVTGGAGIYLFGKSLKFSKLESFLAFLFYLLLPFSYIWLQSSNGLHLVAFSAVPFIGISIQKFLTKNNGKSMIYLSILMLFGILIDVSILLTIIVEFVCLLLVLDSVKERSGYFLTKFILLILLILSLASVWYGFGFWFTLLSNPSFGGLSMFAVIKLIFQLLFNFIPILVAVWVVKGRRIKLSAGLGFSVYYLSAFLFLSIFRFLSDPDFVLDWIGFFIEIQFGLSIFLSTLLLKKTWIPTFLVLLPSAFLSFYLLRGFIPQDRQVLNYKLELMSLIGSNMGSNERIFLSGSPVFWTNSRLSVNQVRGGRDEGAINPVWSDGSYQIREGEDSSLTLDWLKVFGAKYILINDPSSVEFFKDFKNQDRFKSFELIQNISGNKIYKINQSPSIARIAGKEIIKALRPVDGKDSNALANYVGRIKKPVEKFWYSSPNKIKLQVEIQKDEVVNLAITADGDWTLDRGAGRIEKDNFGNLNIIPDRPGIQEFTLIHKSKKTSWLVLLILLGIFVFILIKFELIYKKVSKSFIKISKIDEDEE